jgi:hypothetical protein
MGFAPALLLLFSALGGLAAPACPAYTADGCATCTTKTWLDGFKHCGFCHDAGNQGCLDGSEGGPFESGKCQDWEWYDGGVPGGKVPIVTGLFLC